MSGNKRQQILDAALRLIEREGPLALKQTRVAREAGVEQGHLTYYFPHKLDLAVAVLERIVERQREAAFAFVVERRDGDPRRRAVETIKRTVRDRKRTRLLLTFVLALEVEEPVARVRAQLQQNRRAQQQALAALFGRDEDDGEIAVALAAIRGLAMDQVLVPQPPEQLDAVIDEIVRWLTPA